MNHESTVYELYCKLWIPPTRHQLGPLAVIWSGAPTDFLGGRCPVHTLFFKKIILLT
jgi:hypothetical protein